MSTAVWMSRTSLSLLRSSSRACSRSLSTKSRSTNSQEPEVTVFSGTSKPRPYHKKHPPPVRRDLPQVKSRWPLLLAFAGVGVAGWAAFLTYVTNQEKISSSVVKQVMRSIRSDEKLRDVLGDAIRPQPEWWLNGDPRIIGSISTMQGSIDISFRIKGSKGSGTVYFTSIRKDKGLPFTILRFKVIADDGTVMNIDSETPH